VYGSRGGQLHPQGSHLTPAQARELAATLLVIADGLEPALVTARAASTLGSVTSHAVAHVAPLKEA
jgi:hypothetical protein